MPIDIIDRLKPKQIEQLSLIGKMLAQEEDTNKLEQRWSVFIEESKHDIQIEDIHQLIQFVLRHSYLQMNEMLMLHSEKIKYFNGLEKQIRDHTKKIREYRENYLKSLEDKLNSLVEISIEAQLDLQQASEKQNQVVQTMSNILKMFHDTAKAIIQNIR